MSSPTSVQELRELITAATAADPAMLKTYESMHQGYPDVVLERFLKAREYNVEKAHKMLIDCFEWRIKTSVDHALAKPLPEDRWQAVRSNQLMGMTGLDRQGRPVYAFRIGLSPYGDEMEVEEYLHSHIQMNEYRDTVLLPKSCKEKGAVVRGGLKVLDMTGLRLSHLAKMKYLKAMSSVDDLNYPEKTDVYYIVNAGLMFSTLWKVVKPLLQERTRLKIHVCNGNGREELLQVMDESCLPDFCRPAKDNNPKIATLLGDPSNEVSPSHWFHQEMRNQMVNRAAAEGASPPTLEELKKETVIDAEVERVTDEVERMVKLGVVKSESTASIDYKASSP